MRVISRNLVLSAAAFAVLLAFGGTAEAQPNKCHAGKIKCVSKKKACLLGVEAKARKKGLPPDAAKLQKCKDKFDGGVDPTKGCFAKLETKNDGPCVTFGDFAVFEAKVDAFVADVIDELDTNPANDLNKCTAGKIKCVSKKNKCLLGVHTKAEKLGLPPDAAKLQKCKDKFDGGVDPTKGCFAKLEAKNDGPCLTTNDFAALEAKVDAEVADVLAELASPAPACNPNDNRRCTGNTRTECTTNADCAGPGGTCQFYFGSPLPLAAGGVSTCVTNQFNGAVTGTFNEGTGSSAGSAALIARVYSGPTLSEPCPVCAGDATKNDGVKGGTCTGGDNAMLTCDGNGSHPIGETFGTTSLDCPPLTGGLIASLPVDLSNTTGTTSKTLSAANPNCRAPGFTGLKCFCDTCNNGNQEPCDDNGDCPDPAGPVGPICGGRRCVGGGNSGTPCTVNSECPGGACSVPGAATNTNQCDDSTCSPDGGNEGTCGGGPFDLYCEPVETYRGCTTNADCTFLGDTCTLGKFRECYTDNGTIGETVNATGLADPPTTAGDGHNEADPSLASLFCIGPTTSSAVNSAAGIPGLGRLELPGHATDDSTLTLCPTTIQFLPTAGDLGVLDSGWTGQAHDAKVIDCGQITVSVTGCSGGGQPACGVCSYTGPIPNPGAP